MIQIDGPPLKEKTKGVCFIHGGMCGQPRRRAAARTWVEGHDNSGVYLCLTCAEALQSQVGLRWIGGDPETKDG